MNVNSYMNDNEGHNPGICFNSHLIITKIHDLKLFQVDGASTICR